MPSREGVLRARRVQQLAFTLCVPTRRTGWRSSWVVPYLARALRRAADGRCPRTFQGRATRRWRGVRGVVCCLATWRWRWSCRHGARGVGRCLATSRWRWSCCCGARGVRGVGTRLVMLWGVGWGVPWQRAACNTGFSVGVAVVARGGGQLMVVVVCVCVCVCVCV